MVVYYETIRYGDANYCIGNLMGLALDEAAIECDTNSNAAWRPVFVIFLLSGFRSSALGVCIGTPTISIKVGSRPHFPKQLSVLRIVGEALIQIFGWWQWVCVHKNAASPGCIPVAPSGTAFVAAEYCCDFAMPS